mmetsp:Transcript_6548/g.12088  ORF Transcript_6548/g.12088 Transcript_6548/m.12088 type:complete len:641 (+) Transcript_6548:1-1923(+)
MANQSSIIISNLDAMYSSGGNFEGYLPPSSSIPTVDSTDKAAASSATTESQHALENLTVARSALNEVINVTLLGTTYPKAKAADANVTSNLVGIGDKVLEHVSDFINKENDVESYRSTASTYIQGTSIGLAILLGLSCFFVLFMIAGFCVKQKKIICVGTYGVFILFFWVCVALGVTLVLSMLIYDSCGCDGSYSAESCVTAKEVVKNQYDGETITLSQQDFIVDREMIGALLTCPSSVNQSGYVYTPTSNFVDILQITAAFNITNYITPLTTQLRESSQNFTQTARPLVEDAQQRLRSAASLNGMVSIARGYNFTNDSGRYEYLTGQLTNPTTAPTFYPTFNATVNAKNIERLGILSHTNGAMEQSRDQLEHRQRVLNVSAEAAGSEMDALIASLGSGASRLNSSASTLESVRDFILTANRYTPCAVLGDGWSSVIVGGYCEQLYPAVDVLAPGLILCIVSICCAWFLVTMMKDCLTIERDFDMAMFRAKEIGRRGDIKLDPMAIMASPSEVQEKWEYDSETEIQQGSYRPSPSIPYSERNSVSVAPMNLQGNRRATGGRLSVASGPSSQLPSAQSRTSTSSTPARSRMSTYAPARKRGSSFRPSKLGHKPKIMPMLNIGQKAVLGSKNRKHRDVFGDE